MGTCPESSLHSVFPERWNSHANSPSPNLIMNFFMCSAVTKILDLPENQEVAVLGTLYKEMKLKPSILNEYNKVPLVLHLLNHVKYGPYLCSHRHALQVSCEIFKV